MIILDGKVWYENISKKINDISQLDRDTFKGLFELIEQGANFEIGPGIPPEDGNGLYCTNWTIEQITNYFSNRFSEKETTIDIAEEKSLPNELFDTIINTNYFSNRFSEKEATIDIAEEKSLPNELFYTIINMAKSYQLAYIHASIGFNTGDVLDEISSKYKTEIKPKMKSLSEEDRKKLLTLIETEIEKNDPNVPKNFLENIKEVLTESKKRSI